MQPQAFNHSKFCNQVHHFLRSEVGGFDGEQLYQIGQSIAKPEEQVRYYSMLVKDIDAQKKGQKPEALKAATLYKWEPVGMEEFVTSPYYLNKKSEIYPKVLEELVEINTPGKYIEIVLTGGIGPLSAETEFLTPTGWVRMDQWQGQEVGEYNTTTGQLEFRQPENYVVNPCDTFYHIKSKYGIDMMLSPLHRVLFRNTRGNLQVVTAAELVARYKENDNGFCGKILTTFGAPERKGIALTDDQIRLQVAVQADGSFDNRKDSTYCRLNLKKERKKERLRTLLENASVPFLERPVPGREGYSLFTFHAPLHSKDFEWAWECSKRQLIAITEEVMHWDGSFSDGRYANTCKKSADFIQYAYSALGWRASLSESANESSLCKGTPKTLYRVMVSDRTEPSLQSRKKDMVSTAPSSDGKMYCFTTQTGFFVARHAGKVFITGNCAKTTSALYSTAYQLYLLSCMHNPHRSFNLDPSSEILFIFQSINAGISKASYKRFKSMIEDSEYFKEKFMFDRNVDSRLIFPNRIEIVPISGMETAAIGQNVIGGMIDELNYMSIVNKSKQSVDQGTYNQAVALYNSIARRRKTRFMSGGTMPGLLCLVSSKRYPGQFTDLKAEECEREKKRDGHSTIYIYDYRVWDIKPEGSFTKGMFSVFAGDLTRKPRILKPGEEVPVEDANLVVEVPNDFREDFESDIINALREIAGVSTLARHPYFVDVERVTKAFSRHESVFSRESVDFVSDKIALFPKRVYKPDLPRFVHVDLAISGDSAGIVLGTVTGFKSMKELGFGSGADEMMPMIHIDGILEVRPPKGGEILFWKIREVLTKLRELGVNIRWVTFDSFQSKDSQQLLRQAGFVTGEKSIDTSPDPYDFLKSAVYSGRVAMPSHAKCRYEMISLEKDTKTGKIDHPATGSKDCSDALAGVVYGLTMRREMWGIYNVPIARVPDNIRFTAEKKED